MKNGAPKGDKTDAAAGVLPIVEPAPEVQAKQPEVQAKQPEFLAMPPQPPAPAPQKTPAELAQEKYDQEHPFVPFNQPPAAGQGNRVVTHAMAAQQAKETVRMVVPKPFFLTLDDGTSIEFKAGTYDVPKSVTVKRHFRRDDGSVREEDVVVPVAEHWYVKAHGAKEAEA